MIAPTVEPGRIPDYRRVTPKTCVILSGVKGHRRIFFVSERKNAEDPSTSLRFAQDDAFFKVSGEYGTNRAAKVGRSNRPPGARYGNVTNRAELTRNDKRQHGARICRPPCGPRIGWPPCGPDASERRPYGCGSEGVRNLGRFGPMCLNRPLRWGLTV